MTDLIKMHRHDDGHEIEFDRGLVALIEPGENLDGSVVTLNLPPSTRILRLKESYDEVKAEVHMTSMQRALRRFEERRGEPSEVPFG